MLSSARGSLSSYNCCILHGTPSLYEKSTCKLDYHLNPFDFSSHVLGPLQFFDL